MSDCLVGQAACHGACSLKMALRMTRSLRMQAVSASFLHFTQLGINF